MRIRIDEKTGFPVVEGEEEGPRKPRRTRKRDEMIVEEEEDEEEEGAPVLPTFIIAMLICDFH